MKVSDAPNYAFEGFLLAGGASSRMGVPKASLEIAGRSLARRGAEVLLSVTDRVRIVGDKDNTAHDIDLPWLADVAADGRGSIRGLVTALEACERTWTFVLACDLPFVSGEFLELIASRIEPKVDVIVPVQHDGRLQPLCALYRTAECAPLARVQMLAGRWSLHRLLDNLRVRKIQPDEYEGLKYSQNFFLNINSPADLAAANTLVDE